MNLTIFDRISCLNGIKLLRDVPLSQYTRFGIGGPADFYIETADPESFAKALAMVRESGMESVVIGGGTNLIVSDDGFRGVCLKLTSDRIRVDGLRVDVECGASLQGLVDFTVQHGLKGLETLERNCAVLVDLVFYVQQWYPEALVLAEQLRKNAREIEWHVSRLKGAEKTGKLESSFADNAQRAVATYYVMTRRVLALYEQLNVPGLIELQRAL